MRKLEFQALAVVLHTTERASFWHLLHTLRRPRRTWIIYGVTCD